MEVLHWSRLQGRKFAKRLHPTMLTPSGYNALQYVLHPDTLVRGNYYVNYDVMYVKEFLKKALVEDLAMSCDEALKLIVPLFFEQEAALQRSYEAERLLAEAAREIKEAMGDGEI